MRAALLILVATTAVVAAPVPKDFKKQNTDRDRIVGRWQRVPGTNEFWEFFADGTANLSNQGPNQPPIYYTMEPEGTPKAFGWKPSWGTWKGVYEVTGDELRIAIVSGNGKMPTEARAGTGYEFYEFRRTK